VDIRARVAGFLEKITFEPDTKVKVGDLLFVIDPRQYQAAVEQAAATLAAQKAGYRLAQTDEELAKTLESKEAVSWLKLQQAIAKSGVSKGDVETAQASLDQAKLNLEYTQVVSPINGRVSRNLVDVGNLVGATEKTLLTTVVNDESVYCYFNVTELDVLAVKRKPKVEDDHRRIGELKIPAFLGLADEVGYPHEGYVDYADTKLNPTTGTVQVRAIFPNPDGFLLAGMFARVRMPIDHRKALLIPDVAVQVDQGGRYVMVIDNENVVHQKRIKIGHQDGALRVVDEGLGLQDRVIVTGVQRARPGAKVNPTASPDATPQPHPDAQKTPPGK